MDPEERARLVNDAMMEYECRQQADRNSLLVKEHLVQTSPANGGKTIDLPRPRQPTLRKRLAKLKGREEIPPPPPPPPLQRGAYRAQSRQLSRPDAQGHWRPCPRRPPRPAGRDPTLVAATELPQGLLAAAGVPPPPGLQRGAARRSVSQRRPQLALRRVGGGGALGPPLRTEWVGEQRTVGRRVQPPRRRSWSTRAAGQNGVGADAEEQDPATSDGDGDEDGSSQDPDSDEDEDAEISSQDPDGDGGGDGDGDESEAETGSQEVDMFGGNGYACDSDGDDGMITVFPCVQVVQNHDGSGGESDLDLHSNRSLSDAISDAVLSSSDSEMSPELSPPPPPPPPPRLQPKPPTRTIVVKRPDGASVSAVLRIVPSSSKGRAAAAAAAAAGGSRMVMVVDPPPPTPPAAADLTGPSGDSSDELSESELERGDADSSLASDGSGREDSTAEMSPDSAMPPAELQSWNRELCSLRTQLAEKETELRLQRVLLDRDTAEDPAPESEDAGYPVPASPPPLPELSLRPELVPRRRALTALRQLKCQHIHLHGWALRATLGQRQAQLQAAAARLRVRRERRRLRGQLGGLLTAAQWTALEEGRQPAEWPEEDLQRAAQLRAACGDSGYQFLQRQWKVPLPDLAALPAADASTGAQVAPSPPPAAVERNGRVTRSRHEMARKLPARRKVS